MDVVSWYVRYSVRQAEQCN